MLGLLRDIFKKTYTGFAGFFAGPEAQAREALENMAKIWEGETVTGLLNGSVSITEQQLISLLQRQGTGELQIDKVEINGNGVITVEGMGGHDAKGPWQVQLQIVELRYGEWDVQMRLAMESGAAAVCEKVAIALGQAIFGRFLGPIGPGGCQAVVSPAGISVFVEGESFWCRRKALAVFGYPIAENLHIAGVAAGVGVLFVKASLVLPEEIRSVLKFLAPQVKQHGTE